MEIIKLIGSLIISLVEGIAKILPFTSKFGIIKYVCEQGTIFGVSWIDKSLFFLANILSIAIVFLISSKTSMNAKTKTGVSILVYLIVLSLFAEKIFWFVMLGIFGLIILYFITYLIINIIKAYR
jgi:hypothetical protein